MSYRGIQYTPVDCNTDGTFRAADAYDVGVAVSAATLADVNGDGFLDMPDRMHISVEWL
jgi:hypothetical protein